MTFTTLLNKLFHLILQFLLSISPSHQALTISNLHSLDVACRSISNSNHTQICSVFTRKKLGKEILLLWFNRIIPEVHHVALLLPFFNRFLQFHAAFDHQHIDDSNICDIFVFLELLPQFGSALGHGFW